MGRGLSVHWGWLAAAILVRRLCSDGRRRLDLAQQASDSPEIRALENQLAAEPENKQLKQELAIQYSQAGRKQEALDLLFTILQQELSFGDARKTYQDILATMGADPLVSKYRKKLYTLLY